MVVASLLYLHCILADMFIVFRKSQTVKEEKRMVIGDWWILQAAEVELNWTDSWSVQRWVNKKLSYRRQAARASCC